jgi:SAM-dependent methyltransferase
MTLAVKNIADVRAYWDSRPCNVRRSPAPVGSPQFFSDTERNKYFVEPHIPGFAEFGKWKDKRVLEFGCGIGIDTTNFAKAGAEVFAIDLSAESIKIAVRRAELANQEIVFWTGDAERVPVIGNCDLVYAFGSIHHSPSPEKIIANARESLKPGGTLKLMVYNAWSWKALWILLKYGHGKFWKFSELVAKYSEAQTGCPITHVYSKRSIRAMLERNGFTVRKMEIDHIFKWRIPEYRECKYVESFPWRICPDWLFRRLERIVGWHILVEATA